MRPVAVETEALTRRFGTHVAVDALDVRVHEGTIFGFLGLNGAGKSTTIKLLTTLLSPTSGTATVAGHDIVTEPLAVRSSIGLVGDARGESRPSWNAIEYVSYAAGLRDLRNRRDAVKAALAMVGLDPKWWARPMGTFSTGMKRRVELARALVGEPRVLFLDEPTAALDLPAKREIWDLLRRRSREERLTVFVSSHEVAEIQALCDEVGVIASGRLVRAGPTREFGSTMEDFERRLIGLLR